MTMKLAGFYSFLNPGPKYSKGVGKLWKLPSWYMIVCWLHGECSKFGVSVAKDGSKLESQALEIVACVSMGRLVWITPMPPS